MKLPGAATNNSHMVMHTSMSNTCISLTREFQKHISEPTCAHGLIDHRKYRKQDRKSKRTEREYHVHDIKYVLGETS